jgi:hypothetical protein
MTVGDSSAIYREKAAAFERMASEVPADQPVLKEQLSLIAATFAALADQFAVIEDQWFLEPKDENFKEG